MGSACAPESRIGGRPAEKQSRRGPHRAHAVAPAKGNAKMATSTCRGSVPAFLSFDVEPEGFQVDTDASRAWEGFESALEMAASLRERLALRSGSVPQFGWCFRTDPQIREAYGRADAAMAGYADAIQGLRSHGDYFGVHMHPIRWSASGNQWIHDVDDRTWLRDCTHASLDAFEEWNGSPARHFRAGAGFIHGAVRLHSPAEPGYR